jgi:citrate lyase subunit alpha/citrate CoA-transferase
MSKVVGSLKEAVKLSGLRDGMRISFHHHLRNGDHVINMVMNEIANLGLKDLTVNASSVFDIHAPLINHIKNNVVTGLEVNYMGGAVGREISSGIMEKPVEFRSHGGRPSDIEMGKTPIDVAFIAAPTSDNMGNCTGKYGKSACGSLGYAFVDAMHAKKVVVITDNLVDYPLYDFSISETYVDYVVCVDKIGDPTGIVSGTTKITRDPVGLMMANYATKVIQHSGLLKNGFSFQTGAGGASLAVAKYLKELMLRENIKGSFGMGGITAYLVDMLEAGCFEALMDVQCFDLRAVQSIRESPKHREVTATHYASPTAKSAIVDNLDVVILGATQIDTDFNVNVHTDSNGYIMGGSGGHSDTAAGAKLTMIVAPLTRARLNIVVDKVLCVSTPGKTVDVLVTQRGIAVNPLRKDIMESLKQAKLPVIDIHDLKSIGDKITGVPKDIKLGDKIVGNVIYRDGTIIDTIKKIGMGTRL